MSEKTVGAVVSLLVSASDAPNSGAFAKDFVTCTFHTKAQMKPSTPMKSVAGYARSVDVYWSIVSNSVLRSIGRLVAQFTHCSRMNQSQGSNQSSLI